jgi:DNA polymerase I-like protein with 3'-5' exonuclease and polymerase domains
MARSRFLRRIAVKQAIIDFESESIKQRPNYPPIPVGLAFKLPGGLHTYAAWGHPQGTNGIFMLKKGGVKKISDGDPKKYAVLALKDANKCDSILGHNIAKFDADLAETHMGVKLRKIDDSLFSRFLVDPHAASLSLKPSAELVLGEPPEERDLVFEWLHQHGFIQRRIEKGKFKYQKDAGACISKAPGDLVAAYAIGDLTRSKGLWDHDMKIIKRDGMLEAYKRELQVAPILLTNEQEGMRLDVARLARDFKIYKAALLKVETWLRKKLKAPASINWDSDAEIASALKKSGQVKIFPKTATGKDSVSKKNLKAAFFSDRDVYRALVYRNIVAYVLSQNIAPWSESSDGRAYTTWDQVRGADKGGARSGRITCSKFGNIIKNPTSGKNPDYVKSDDERIRKLIGLPSLPLARVYILPDEGGLFVHRDANQEELRLTAHYEDGRLAKEYNEDPSVDIHGRVQGWMHALTPNRYEREPVKTADFLAFYGGGWRALMAQTGMHEDAAREFMRIWKRAMPDVVALQKRLMAMYQRGEPIRTFGGRIYHCKPPAVATKGDRKGQTISFEYTALNYLIQPSAADLLKMWIITYDQHPKKRGRLLCTVHDEINVSAPKKLAKQENLILKEVMEGIKIDVPWKSDGDERPNWGEEA